MVFPPATDRPSHEGTQGSIFKTLIAFYHKTKKSASIFRSLSHLLQAAEITSFFTGIYRYSFSFSEIIMKLKINRKDIEVQWRF